MHICLSLSLLLSILGRLVPTRNDFHRICSSTSYSSRFPYIYSRINENCRHFVIYMRLRMRFRMILFTLHWCKYPHLFFLILWTLDAIISDEGDGNAVGERRWLVQSLP